MAPKKTPTKSTEPESSYEPVASVSKLPKGSGSRRVQTRVITIYGPAKTRKTTSLAHLPAGRTKWLISDPNCIPTLRSLDRLPHEDDIYEVNNLEALREFLDSALKLCEDAVTEGRDPRKELGVDFLVLDSWTQFSDWHQQDVSKATGQRFLGDNDKDNGWQRFNADMGACLDLWAALGRYVTVIGIVHAKEKFKKEKGEYASFSLSPAMAMKLGRLSNWILLKTLDEVVDDDVKQMAFDHPEDLRFSILEDRGEKLVYEDLFYTRTTNGWLASVNSMKMQPTEPGRDICALLEKDGLL